MARFLALAVLAGTLMARAAEPPLPDPKNPVDYIAWLNAEFAKDLFDNAAGLYRQAGEALAKNEDLSRLAATPVRGWSPQQREEVRAWVDRNFDALNQLTAAAAKKRCYFELHSQDGSLIGSMLREFPDMWALARILTLRGQLRLAAGDVDGAVQDAVALLDVAQHRESQPILVSYHGGLMVRSLAYSLLLEIPRAPAQHVDFAAILARVQQADVGPSSPKLQYLFEKLLAWDTAQRFLKDGDGDGGYTAEGTRHHDGEMTQGIVFGPQTWDEVLRDINQYFGDLDKAAGLEYPQAREAAAQLKERVAAATDSFMRTMSPHRTLALSYYARAMAHHRGALLVLHLHAYRAKHGHWPADLKTMLAFSEQALATDPFSGHPFVYRLEKGEPRLYSVSENGQDDGGELTVSPRKLAWRETGDYVFWPPAP